MVARHLRALVDLIALMYAFRVGENDVVNERHAGRQVISVTLTLGLHAYTTGLLDKWTIALAKFVHNVSSVSS